MTEAWHDGCPQPFTDIQSEEIRDNLATANSHAAGALVPFNRSQDVIGALWFNTDRREYQALIGATFFEGFSPHVPVTQLFDDFEGCGIRTPPWTYSSDIGTVEIVEACDYGTIVRLHTQDVGYAELSTGKAQFWFGVGTGSWTMSTMDPRLIIGGRAPIMSYSNAVAQLGFKSNLGAFAGFVAGLSDTIVARVSNGAGTTVEKDTGVDADSLLPYMFEVIGGTYTTLRLWLNPLGPDWEEIFLTPGLTHFFYPYIRIDNADEFLCDVDIDFVRVTGLRAGWYF